MRTASNGTMSFKKGGRLEAALLRWQTNNLVVLSCRAGNLTVATENLSEADRSYVARSNGTDETVRKGVEQSALVRNEMTRRRREAAQLRDEAAANRQLAQDELVAAKDLEKQADQLNGRPVRVEIQSPSPAQAEPKDQGFSSKTTAGPNAALIVAGASDQLQQDITQRRVLAQQKRDKAASLQNQAEELEATAQAEEQNSLSGPSVAQ